MDEIKRLQEERRAGSDDNNSDRIQLGTKSHGFDTNLYGDGDEGSNYLQSLPTDDEERDDEE